MCGVEANIPEEPDDVEGEFSISEYVGRVVHIRLSRMKDEMIKSSDGQYINCAMRVRAILWL